MLEVYSRNVTVASGENIPLNNVVLIKGTSSQMQGAATILLNKCGIYQITVSDVATASEAGVVTIQMQRNGLPQVQAQSSVTAADTTSLNPMFFSTLVQVTQNNNINCPCSIPTTISFTNSGVAAVHSLDITVTRI